MYNEIDLLKIRLKEALSCNKVHSRIYKSWPH